MTDYKDSEAYKEVQNNRLAAKIAIAVAVAIHIIGFIASKARFINVGEHPLYWGLPVLALGSLVFTVIELLKGAETTELQRWPYISLIFLTWASAWALFYCSAC